MSAVRIPDDRLGNIDAAVISRNSVAAVDRNGERFDGQRTDAFRGNIIVVFICRIPGDPIGVARGPYSPVQDAGGGYGRGDRGHAIG